MDTYLKRTWAEIDLDALAHNTKQIRAHLHPHTKLMGVVKADGYGHGAVAVAALLQQQGVDMLGVSNINEAMQLRRHAITLPILILGYTPPEMAALLLDNHLTQTIYSHEQATALSEACAALKQPLTVHVKVDTGMSRLGFCCEDIDAIAAAYQLPFLTGEGLFTHFSSGDDAEFTSTQMARFMAVRRELANRGIKFSVNHCANSSAVLQYPYTHFDMVRPGLLLYGQLPSAQAVNNWDLRPVMSLHTIVSQVKRIHQGDGVSYDRRYIAPDDRTVAVIPVGYADGYPRLLSNRATALVNGIEAPFLGNICMDMSILDVTDIPDVCEGTPVVLFGNQNGTALPVTRLANQIGTINYEILCNVGKRVPRVYLQNNAEVGYQDSILGHEGNNWKFFNP